MRSKTKILIGLAISLALSAMVVFFVHSILGDIKNESARVQAYSAIEDKIEALNLSLARFSSQPDESRILQIKSIRASLENLLGMLNPSDAREELLVRQIRTYAQELGYSFEKLIEGSGGQVDGMPAERRDILSAQFWMKTQFISDDTQHLMEISRSRTNAAQQKAGILILALIVILILINVLISFFSGRSILRVQEALQESENRFRLANKAAKMGIFVRDLQTGEDYWSPEFLAIYGHGPDDQLPLKEGIPAAVHPEDFQRILDARDRFFQPPLSEFINEHRIILPDGQIRWVMIRGRNELDVKDQPFRTYGLVMDITERKQAEEALRQLNETLEERVAKRTELAEKRTRQLQSLSVELIEAEERERRRIARLLHEDLQQIIASARLQLQAFRKGLPAEPTLMDIEKLLVESIRKSRRITHELSPTMLEHSSLLSALKWLARHMDEQIGLQVELKLGAEQPPESQPLKVFTFRAMQEFLSNVQKHSGVKVAEVELSIQNDLLVLTVSDQGRGFNPESLDSVVAKDGFGLLSLRERVNYIGGNLLIESAPGKGSKFILSIPVNSFQVETPESSTHDPNQAPSADAATNGCIRVLLADGHKVMRQGLVKMLSRQPNIEIAGEATNGREVVELARQIKPDVILMDTSMPDMDGIETTRLIKAELPHASVIGLSMFPDEQCNSLMREAGVEAFTSKSGSAGELLETIYRTYRNRRSSEHQKSLVED